MELPPSPYGTQTQEPPIPAGPGYGQGYGLPAAPRPARPPQRPQQRGWRRILAPIAAAGAAIVKYGALLWKLKVIFVVGSMLVSLAAYTWLFGWTFALGFVLLIFIHEMGHVVVLRAQGIRASAPIFLPFLGAFVSMKSQPSDVAAEARSALAGPVTGTLAAIGCWAIADATGSTFWRALAYTGFFLNLFNLLPALPLDGGRVAGALHPAVWLAGLLALVGFEIYAPSPVIPIVLILGGFELYRRWKARHTAASRRYHSIARSTRVAIGTSYLGMVGFLVFAMDATYRIRHL